jgi:hypothetical protein
MPKPLRVRYSRIQRDVDALLSRYSVVQPHVDIIGIAESEGATISYERLEDDLSGFFVSGKRNFVIGVNNRAS